MSNILMVYKIFSLISYVILNLSLMVFLEHVLLIFCFFKLSTLRPEELKDFFKVKAVKRRRTYDDTNKYVLLPTNSLFSALKTILRF